MAMGFEIGTCLNRTPTLTSAASISFMRLRSLDCSFQLINWSFAAVREALKSIINSVLREEEETKSCLLLYNIMLNINHFLTILE